MSLKGVRMSDLSEKLETPVEVKKVVIKKEKKSK